MIRFPILAVLIASCAHSPVQLDAYTAQAERPRHFGNTVDVGQVRDIEMQIAFQAFARLAEQGEKTATLRIDSPGGSIFLGLRWIQVMNDLKRSKGMHVSCVVDNMAASMAAVILESHLCDERFATPYSMILFHNGSTSAEGTAEDLRRAREFLEAVNEAMALLISHRIGMPVDTYRARIAHGDWVMATPEAIRMGVIDGVVSPDSIDPPAP